MISVKTFLRLLKRPKKQCDIHVVSSTLCEHNNCSWDKDPNKLTCLDCGKETTRA